MARKRDRAFAAFGAGLFLLTSSALTIAVIVSMIDQKKQDEKNNAATNSKEENVDNGQKLEGTKLANFTPVDNIPELKIEDPVPGTGEEVKAGDTVTVDYTGAIGNTGVIFQSSKDSGQPVSFGLDQVIKGWTQGMPGMKVGGTRRLYIPSDLAYGSSSPAANIPANSDLVFDITLHKVGK